MDTTIDTNGPALDTLSTGIANLRALSLNNVYDAADRPATRLNVLWSTPGILENLKCLEDPTEGTHVIGAM